jgi:hypothetical protein
MIDLIDIYWVSLNFNSSKVAPQLRKGLVLGPGSRLANVGTTLIELSSCRDRLDRIWHLEPSNS